MPQPNHVLRRFRSSLHLTQAEFAGRIRDKAAEMGINVACDEKRVGRWERGEITWPSPTYRRILKELWDKEPQELGFVPPPEEDGRDAGCDNGCDNGRGNGTATLPADPIPAPAGAPAVPAPRPGGGSEEMAGGRPIPLDRRTFLLGGGVAALGLPGGESGAMADALRHFLRTGRVNPALVDHLYEVREVLARSDNLLGPHHVLRAAHDYLQVIDQARRTAEGEQRIRLLRLQARYAEFLGWLYQDAGDYHAALYWSDRAMECAQEADDQAMVAYVLSRKGHQASERHDPDRTVGLARAAQRVPAPPRVRALAARLEARGHALARDAYAAQVKLEEARELVASAESEPRELAAFCTEPYLDIQEAECWIHLGQPARSVEIYTKVLDSWPEKYHRDRGVYLSRCTHAYAAAGEPEQACALALEALAIAGETGSVRIVQELERLTSRLTPWDDLTQVAELREILAGFPRPCRPE